MVAYPIMENDVKTNKIIINATYNSSAVHKTKVL